MKDTSMEELRNRLETLNARVEDLLVRL